MDKRTRLSRTLAVPTSPPFHFLLLTRSRPSQNLVQSSLLVRCMHRTTCNNELRLASETAAQRARGAKPPVPVPGAVSVRESRVVQQVHRCQCQVRVMGRSFSSFSSLTGRLRRLCHSSTSLPLPLPASQIGSSSPTRPLFAPSLPFPACFSPFFWLWHSRDDVRTYVYHVFARRCSHAHVNAFSRIE